MSDGPEWMRHDPREPRGCFWIIVLATLAWLGLIALVWLAVQVLPWPTG